MPKYVVIHAQPPEPPGKSRTEGQGGNLELDYQLPIRHVFITSLFAFLGSPWLWLLLAVAIAVLIAVPGGLRLRLLPIVLVALPFGLVRAFRVAEKEWREFTELVKQSRWAQEVQLGRDLDGDGRIGRPPIIVNGPAAKPTREQVQKQQVDEFKAWILSLDTAGTAFRAHEDLGRDEYERRRDKLMAAGWAEWKNPGVPTLGWRLTVPAAEVAQSIE